MRHSTNQFNVNDAVNALPTFTEYVMAELQKQLDETQPTILSY